MNAKSQPQKTSGRRVTQETIDEMAALRRQGLPFEQVGARVGCSERTARRYVGHVEPELSLPPSKTEPNTEDPQERIRRNLGLA
jgi:hypothetical protein